MVQPTMHRLTSLIVLLAVTSSAKEQGRWSRQISSYTSDISDWVPLPGPVEREPPLPPIKRQAVAEPRILTEPFPGLPRPTGFSSEMFPSRTFINAPANRHLYLQSVPSVPSAPQNYLSEQGFSHGIKFGLSQPNFGLNQGFISPQFGYESIPQNVNIPPIKTKPQIPSNPIKFENFQKNTPLQVPLAVPIKAFNNQPHKINPETPKFIDGYRAENASNDFEYSQKKKPQSLQKIKFENYEKPIPRPEIPRPEAPKLEVPQNVPKQQSNQKVQREEVQLLYVPLESLNRGQFNFRSPYTTSQLLNTDLYSQGTPPISQKKSMTELHRPIQKIQNPLPQEYFTEFNAQLHSLQQKEVDQVPKFSTLSSPFLTSSPVTPKPKKLKPHQPPLAIFLTEESNKNNQIKVADVLNSLKTQRTVAVLDSVNPLNAPKVFIGPSSLQPPEHYVKFELPYLSNIENTDKKLRQLPFFVAPLSYNTPQGFAKIPFPSPHVGSVVINSQISETTTQRTSTENVQPNYYTGTYRQEQKPLAQKPTVSFFTTTAPKTNLPSTYQNNYYQFEPQTVSTLRPLKEPETVAPSRPGNYFLSNSAQYSPQYDPPQYELQQQNNYQLQQDPEQVKSYTIPKQVETTTTPRTTISTTTKLPSTYPSQLLETHNPYSINQAFHFSTPLDYRTYNGDEFKEPLATPVQFNPSSTPQRLSTTTVQTPKVEEAVTEQQRYQQQTSPQYQSYSPEIHYESEIQNTRYPAYSTNDYQSKTETPETYSSVQSGNPEFHPTPSNSTEYTHNTENYSPVRNTQNSAPVEEESKLPTTEIENPTRFEQDHYETDFNSNEAQTQTSSTTSTTTTRRPLRGRGRPRYTTTPRTESGEYSTRSVTRRPLRERRPLPARPRYEPNKITTDKPTRKPEDYSEESTTKSARTRIRGRVTYKPTEEIYDRRRTHNSKEQDLAYQRDVLHQNYPVTIQERSSTVDIEAITEPTIKLSSNKDTEPNTETYDTENAYTYERATITQQNPDSNEDIPVFSTRTTLPQMESSYIPRLSSRNEEYVYQSRSSLAPVESIAYDEALPEKEEDSNSKQTTTVQKETESVVFATEATSSVDENNDQTISENEEYHYKEEETTLTPETEVTKRVNQESEEENVIQTTPSYNRVRVRPGVIKQYHQASTESSKIKIDRRRPVTYRPAFDKRRTTMRIDEIQQDLKTKQVHSRPEVEEYRHPVYKPESSSEATSTQEVTTKRGAIRRRRPNYSYTTSTTERLPIRKNTYDVKNRLRRRRPTTEKPTEKTEITSETPTTTVRVSYSRYSQKPRLSERFNARPEPEPEETEDQDSNFSINRPTYTEPDTGKWSPKIVSDSFKPYNPNNIVDEERIASTERRSDAVEMDIITARNENEDILISVTPATNNRNIKKMPEIPPTLEALVEQSKVTKSDAKDNMSTFESMLEEVMKSLEEQDEDEYTTNVMKHKGGEIGEIPPERVISSEEGYYTKATSPITQESTTVETIAAAEKNSTTNEEETERTTRRRGFWKKVKVRPVSIGAESFEAAESQYYPTTVNRLGQTLKPIKSVHGKSKHEKKVSVTTYKPAFQFVKDIFSYENETADEIDSANEEIEISKVNEKTDNIEKEEKVTTEAISETQTAKTEVSPGDLDLGTGSPDPTIDNLYNTPTEPTTDKAEKQSFSFMDFLFGTTSEDDSKLEAKNETATTQIQIEITTELAKSKMPTTESSFIPDEIISTTEEDVTETIEDINKVTATTLKEEITTTELPKTETSSQSSFMDPANVVSTSMSTEISHETEICFRGKCIKTFKDIL